MDKEKVLSLENLVLALNSNNIKIKQLINDMLLLMQQDIDNNISNHIDNNIIHVTQNDKDLWNSILDNAKAYANTLFNGVTSLTIEIVDALPTENIKQMTIYFIRNGYNNESDYYDEYMYINNKWEIIGSTFVNLAPYLLREEFESYKQHIANKFLDYKTSNELNDILNDYLPIEVFQRLIEDYAKKEQLHEHNNKDILDKLSESQNGVLLYDNKEIEGGSNITISENENNAIKQKDDGIFTEDKTQEINNLKIRTEQINIAQKTVNTEHDYFYHKGVVGWVTVSGDISKYFTAGNTNMKVNENGHVVLKAGKKYLVTCDTLSETNGAYIYIKTNGNVINSEYNTGYHASHCQVQSTAIICPEEESLLSVTTSSNNTICFIHSYLYIQEIGHDILIDPVEYINTTQGIEDTPVGHIISHMGNTAPKHYLICDGTEYNITDYPNLAQHFKDEFGTYNYFGGDGLNTFCVPDLRGEFLRGTGENSRENQGSGANVGEHQDGTKHVNTACGGGNNQILWPSTKSTFPENMESEIDYRSTLSHINGNNYNTSHYFTYYTSRPTNTSVLYCIKYEPTYYMNVTQTISLEEAKNIKEQNELLQEEINSLNSILDSINRVVI